MTNRCFWKTVTPFLNSKGDHGQQTIILEENDKIHENPTNIADIFNDYFVNIAEITTGKPPPSYQEKVNIPEVLDRYSTHPSIQQIKSKFSDRMPFQFLSQVRKKYTISYPRLTLQKVKAMTQFQQSLFKCLLVS